MMLLWERREICNTKTWPFSWITLPWRLLKITGVWHDVTMREKRNMQYKDIAIFLDYRAVEV